MNFLEEQNLADEIYILLGGTILDLEITKNDIKSLVKVSLRKIAPYINSTAFVKVQAAPIVRLDDDVVSVVRVFESPDYSTGADIDETKLRVIDSKDMTSYIVESARRSEIDRIVNRSFKVIGRDLYLDKFYGAVTLEVIKRPKLSELDEFSKSWVFDYTLALSKEAIGRIRSKYKANTPIELDTSLLSEGLAEKERLESILKDDGHGFFMVLK